PSTRSEKLAALATLAAGAAHELSTPLSTIAVVAREIERRLEATGESGLRDDARLLREEVGQCRAVLEQLAAEAGGSLGTESQPISVDALLEGLVDGAAPRHVRVEVDENARGRVLEVPLRPVLSALRGVVKNAHQASP